MSDLEPRMPDSPSAAGDNDERLDMHAPEAPNPPPNPSAPGATNRTHSPLNGKKPRKKGGCLAIFLILAGVVVVLAVVGMCVAVALAVTSAHPLQGKVDWSISRTVLHEAHDTDDRIAVIDIQGIIMGTDSTKGTSSGIIKSILAEVENDPDVKAILLNLDTPGGEVLASDEIYHAVAQIDIPVVACMRSVCASGGYYIAAAADHIVANEVTLTGSIGVIIPRYQYSDMLGKIGVEATAIRSGAMKDMLSGGRERTPQEATRIDAYVQSLVDETFRRFCIVVATGRDAFLTWEDVKESPFGDGRVVLGNQARDMGLVDECGYFEQAVEAAKRLAGIEQADVIRYQKTFTFAELLFSQARADVKIETGLESLLPTLQPTQMYYLMPNLAD